jgi:leucyl aminopeptidase
MFQQDMTGFTAGTTKAGKAASMGVITDYVDVGLTGFIKKIITVVSSEPFDRRDHAVRITKQQGKYCPIPYVGTKCGYACSDHASASNAGYPSAFVIESASEYTSPYIHGMSDMMDTVDLDHVIEHAKMTVGFSYELAFASL